MTDSPTVVIGAGHNGLVCAAYLARAGRRVIVLEAGAAVGGGAVTREFHPGFRVSGLAHLQYLLDPVVSRDLDLAGRGLAPARASLRTIALSTHGTPLIIESDRLTGGDVSAADLAAYPDYLARMQRLAEVIARQHGRVPPRLTFDSWRTALPAARLAFDIRRLGRADMREFLRIATMPIRDLLDEHFDSPRLKGALALDAVLGTRLGPRSGGTVYTSLYRGSLAAVNGYSAPRGGMGAVSAALAAAARSAGAEIRLSSQVAAIRLDGDRVCGITLSTGEELPAATVVSGTDPKQTFLVLLGARHLEAEFARRVSHLRTAGTAAKVHLALNGPPAFGGVAEADRGERLLIAPDPDYVERAFNPAKYGGYSPAPVMEIHVPTVHDPDLAPPGRHVLSAIVQYVARDADLQSTPERDRLLEIVLDKLEQHAPGIRRQVVASELLAPADIEREFRITGGHWHHAELSLDQFLMLRPVPGAAQYATPVTGLYLCSAGSHPGGGIMGTAGRNAARAILARTSA